MTGSTRSEPPVLVLATTNRGKEREIASWLDDVPWQVVSQRAFGVFDGVEEDGTTYEENALKKAVPLAARLGIPVLADDSGLEVDALDRAPGVRSARFAGPGAGDAENRRLLLDRLTGVPFARRTARFRCAIVVAARSGESRLFEGCVEGRIRESEAGVRGFGYDPVFELEGMGVTFAELSEEDKNRVSHRARALEKVRGMLLGNAAWLK